jgi:XisH protein
MAAKDTYHEAVKLALTKDGWNITNDPLVLKFSNRYKLQIDLAVPIETYEDFFSEEFVQISLNENQMKLMVFNPKLEEVVKWID